MIKLANILLILKILSFYWKQIVIWVTTYTHIYIFQHKLQVTLRQQPQTEG